MKPKSYYLLPIYNLTLTSNTSSYTPLKNDRGYTYPSHTYDYQTLKSKKKEFYKIFLRVTQNEGRRMFFKQL